MVRTNALTMSRGTSRWHQFLVEPDNRKLAQSYTSEDVDVMSHNSLVLLDKEGLGRYCHLPNYPIPGGIEEWKGVEVNAG